MNNRKSISIKTAVIAIVFGYLVMAIILGLFTLIQSQLFGLNPATDREAQVPLWAIVSILVTGVSASFAGGYACSVAYRYVETDSTSSERHRTVRWFAVLMILAASAYTLNSKTGPQPIWYLGIIIVQGPIGIFIGGWLYERRRRVDATNLPCPNCHYDLTGNQIGGCPECGHTA